MATENVSCLSTYLLSVERATQKSSTGYIIRQLVEHMPFTKMKCQCSTLWFVAL